MISTIAFSQTEIIKSIIDLHLKGCPIECDPTYSKGNFYKRITEPRYKFDILPQTEDTVKASSEKLPLADCSLKSLMFDPPFLASSGKSLKSEGKTNNCISKRFGVFPTEPKLFEFYKNSIAEIYRVLKQDGVFIFKCQDKVSSGRQYFSHVEIHNMAVSAGFYPMDLFVLLAKTRIVADWQKANQQHARKFHSYFWVFKKCSRKIRY